MIIYPVSIRATLLLGIDVYLLVILHYYSPS